MMLLHEQSEKFTGNENMKYINLDSKKLKVKTEYSAVLVCFGIAILSYSSIKLFGPSGITKWVLYLIAIIFILIAVAYLIPEISYCKLCDAVFDFDVTECPLCGNKLELLSKNQIEDIRNKLDQERDQERKEISKGNKDIDELIQALKSSDRDIRRAAVSALKKLSDARAVEPLIKALNDNVGIVHQRIVRTLVKFHNKNPIPSLDDHKEDWLTKGTELYCSSYGGAFEDAVDYFDAVLTIDPKNMDALELKRNSLFSKKKGKERTVEAGVEVSVGKERTVKKSIEVSVDEALETTFLCAYHDCLRAKARIAVELAEAGEFDKSKEVLDFINTPGEFNIGDALSDIVIVFAEAGEFENAQEMLKIMGYNPFFSAYTVGKIASELVNAREFEKALETARSISDKETRSIALGNIAVEFAKAGNPYKYIFEEALETARSISNEEKRSISLGNIAVEFAKAGNSYKYIFEDALETARSISDEWDRSGTLSKIASELAKAGKTHKHIFKEALETAKSISDDWDRSNSLSYISIDLAKAALSEKVKERKIKLRPSLYSA